VSSGTLLIRHPPARIPERSYVLDVLVREFLGLSLQLEPWDRPELELSFPGEAPGSLLVSEELLATSDDDWLTSRSLPRRPLERWQVERNVLGEARLVDPLVPILFGRRLGGGSFLEQESRLVRLGADIFGGAFFLLTRYEELVEPTRDVHSRFPATASLAFAEGFLERPLVNEYAELLLAALRLLWPRLPRPTRRPRVILSHDVDAPFFRISRGEARFLALRELRREHAPLVAVRRLLESHVRLAPPARDLYDSFDFIMDVSERAGLASSFNFIASQSIDPIDGAYSLEHLWIRRLMVSIHERGHELGLHPSYQTHRDFDRTREELERFRTTCETLGIDQTYWGGRQHYLRWENPTTWRIWEKLGLDYDSTLGFSDKAGFRSSTCYEHPTFDLLRRRTLQLRERPLVAMEVTLLENENVSLVESCTRIEELARRSLLFNGDFTLLWHNNRLLSRRVRRAYAALIESITRQGVQSDPSSGSSSQT
jgi:hypothetical protein